MMNADGSKDTCVLNGVKSVPDVAAFVPVPLSLLKVIRKLSAGAGNLSAISATTTNCPAAASSNEYDAALNFTVTADPDTPDRLTSADPGVPTVVILTSQHSISAVSVLLPSAVDENCDVMSRRIFVLLPALNLRPAGV